MHCSRRFLHGVSAAAILLLAPLEGLAQQAEGRIQGRVFIEGTRDAVVGAFVRADPPLFSPNGDRLQLAEAMETITDDDGRFALTWMQSGIWNTMVMAEGYEDAQLRIEVAQNRSNACTPTKMQNCVQPIEYYMVPLKVDAAEQVESILAGFDIEETELDRAVAELGAADDAYNRQDYRTAIDGYTSLLARWPQMTTLHQDAGDAHRALAQYEEAIAAYERYRASAPDDTAIERKIARAQLLLGDLAAARDLAAAGGDASPEDLYNLGEVAFSEGDIDAAAGWYEKSAAADPEWAPPVFKLGMVALNRGDIPGAKALFQQVVDIAPESEEAAQAQGILSALP